LKTSKLGPVGPVARLEGLVPTFIKRTIIFCNAHRLLSDRAAESLIQIFNLAAH